MKRYLDLDFGLTRFLLAAALILMIQPAFAEKRVALVIANSAYQNVPPLANPVHDGAMIAATLRKAGFDVVDSRHDLSAAETRRALRDFSDQARDADIALVYYAGHGLEVDGSNYLIPVDARLERDTDIYDEALSLDRILLAVDPARQLRLVILDACRDNPFDKTMKRTMATRGIGRGLAKIEPASPNTLIAYSAKAGSTALDGDGKNSPFTIALAQHLTTPGLDVRKAFGFVRDDVLKATANRQEPFVYGSLGGDDVALVPAPSAARPAADSRSGERADYELALQVGNKAALNAFLAQYPNGFYANLARLQLQKLAAAQSPEQPAASAPAANEAKTVAALSPGVTAVELTKSVQAELRRVGCLDGQADGDWNATSQRSLALFNRYAGTKLDVKIASSDALDAIRQKQARVCPLLCDHGFKADGDHCSKIVCDEGSVLNEDNECEKRRGKTPVARRDNQDRSVRRGRLDHSGHAGRGEWPRLDGGANAPPRAQASRSGSGQIVCDFRGCRPVEPGCHIEYKTTAEGGPREGGGGNVQVCR